MTGPNPGRIPKENSRWSYLHKDGRPFSILVPQVSRSEILTYLHEHKNTKMMTLQHVTELNNQTVAFMNQQQFYNAIVSASSALNLQRALGQEIAVTSKNGGFIDECMLHDDVDEPCDTSTEEFIYKRGILLPSDTADTIAITKILVFNSALSHQLLAEHQEGTKQLDLLHKAKRLYELVYNYDTEEDVLFAFAIINNTSIILKAIGNATSSKECLDYLISLTMLLVDRGCTIQLRQIQGFLVNMTSNAETAPAA